MLVILFVFVSEQMTDEMESKTAAANTRGPNVKGRRSITMSAIV